MSEPSLPSEPTRTPSLAHALARWLRDGVRSSLFLRPRWAQLHASPATILGLIACGIVTMLVLQRLWIVGPATFLWEPLLAGWAGTAAAAWGCYALLHPSADNGDEAPAASQLFCLLLAQGYVLSSGYGLLWVVAIRSGNGMASFSPQTLWVFWIALWVWMALAQLVVLLRDTRRKRLALTMAVLLVAIGIVDNMADQRMLWVADATAATDPAPQKQLKLTQEIVEAQPQLLQRRLEELLPQRPGVVDLYALTFAPYAHEDVFKRESQMVAEVLASRFDADGRTVQLVNHIDTLAEWPWATPLNLQRTIQRIAALMDKDEDVLLIHLTSHGAQNGELAADFWPLSVAGITPRELKRWLDEAGIRHRVVSVSACYSGTWLQPLADDATLVMTAADSTHTSYGCGRHSELTYFGRALYDEQLRLHTRSFEEAHAAARPLIERREKEAGKTDGYSNPLLGTGEGIRRQLDLLRRQLEADRPPA